MKSMSEFGWDKEGGMSNRLSANNSVVLNFKPDVTTESNNNPQEIDESKSSNNNDPQNLANNY